jgi:hypothetical protein
MCATATSRKQWSGLPIRLTAIASLWPRLTCPNIVGTPGTRFSSEDVVRDATVKLDENDSPMDDQRYIIVNSRMEQDITKATKLQFNDQGELGKQYKRGRMGTALGYNWAMSQVTPRLVSGTLAGTPVVSGGSQTGASLLVSGLPAGATMNAGDNFTIAGVFLTETVSYISHGRFAAVQGNGERHSQRFGCCHAFDLSVYHPDRPSPEREQCTGERCSHRVCGSSEYDLFDRHCLPPGRVHACVCATR